MREIKFRVYFPNQNHIEHFTLQDCIKGDVKDPWKLALLMYPEYKKDQYTGLKDKYGVEIYEGDIIIHDDSLIGGEVNTCEVLWCDDMTLDTPGWGLWVTKGGGYMPWTCGLSEVIGNIYENPAFLER